MKKDKDKVKKRILVLSHDRVGSSMAGPGIRYHYIAQELSKDNTVELGAFDKTYLPEKGFRRDYGILDIDLPRYKEEFRRFDVVIAYWLSQEMMAFLKEQEILVIVDMYCVAPVENLASLALFAESKELNKDTLLNYHNSITDYHNLLNYGDVFLYSNRRQLDYWMGFLFSSPGFGIEEYTKRPLFERFIGAPMGIDIKEYSNFLKNNKKKDFFNVEKDDFVLVWTGGVWNHFDAVTVIDAVAIVSKRFKNVKLFFPGTKHPNPSVTGSSELRSSIQRAKELGLIDKNVFFMEGWVDYSDRLEYLSQADVAIYSHKNSIETEFAHRTRVLDHISAEIPTIATMGDYFAEEIEKNKLGLVVPTDDAKKMADSIVQLMDSNLREDIIGHIRNVKSEYSWANTLSEIVEAISRKDLSVLPVKENLPMVSLPIGYIQEAKRFARINVDTSLRFIGKAKSKLKDLLN